MTKPYPPRYANDTLQLQDMVTISYSNRVIILDGRFTDLNDVLLEHGYYNDKRVVRMFRRRMAL